MSYFDFALDFASAMVRAREALRGDCPRLYLRHCPTVTYTTGAGNRIMVTEARAWFQTDRALEWLVRLIPFLRGGQPFMLQRCEFESRRVQPHHPTADLAREATLRRTCPFFRQNWAAAQGSRGSWVRLSIWTPEAPKRPTPTSSEIR